MLGFRRFRSTEDYIRLQEYVAEATIQEIGSRGVELANAKVLEIGAGRGGYSKVLHRFSGDFIASDFEKHEFFEQNDIPFEHVDAQSRFPFPNDTFDFIYCASVIEHLKEPKILLEEIHRTLKPGGHLMLSFPPFYSVFMIGGHQFKPFHFLGESLAIKCTNVLKGKSYTDYETTLWDIWTLPFDNPRRDKTCFELWSQYQRHLHENVSYQYVKAPGHPW